VPFSHPDLIPMLLLHINEKPELPRLRNPGIPEELESLILRMLEKDPARRPESVRLVSAELAAIRKSYGG
jgi:serine/threonine protein kinase